MDTAQLDVAIVGAGFSGIFALYHLRERGFAVKAFERGGDIGGTWYWNSYPGARVDSPLPIYQFSSSALWSDFTYKEKYPGRDEILRYFDYVDDKWSVRKDIEFNAEVISAQFNDKDNQWNIDLKGGKNVRARWFIPAVGFASKRYVPSMPGLDTFKGVWHHTAVWPKEEQDFHGKRVAVIGTGATGVQVVQEVGVQAKKLVVFQRTPAIAMPMRQSVHTSDDDAKMRESGGYYSTMKSLRNYATGFPYESMPKRAVDATPEELNAVFGQAYAEGGFKLSIGTYNDLMVSAEANDKAYEFWKTKTRERVADPVKQAIVAPDKSPYPVSAKRIPLEQNYYDVLNQENVIIVDVSEKGSPIECITEKGVKTKGAEYEVDVLILATGFDSVTGGMTQMNITGVSGISLTEKWGNGDVMSYLGVCGNGFPNMFWPYGVHGPTAFSNGPTCLEIQLEWVVDTIEYCRNNGIVYLEAGIKSEADWVKAVGDVWNATLMPLAKSWYQGANIPGKKVQPLNYLGGIPHYTSLLEAEKVSGYDGFVHKQKSSQ